MSFHDQIQQVIHTVINGLDGEGIISISPTTIALRVHDQFGSEEEDPHIRYASVEHFKQMARKALAGKFSTEAHESDAYMDDMFSGHLQTRYPIPLEKGREPVYKSRDALTQDELDWNIEQLRKSAMSRLEHADALQAYRDRRGSDDSAKCA